MFKIPSFFYYTPYLKLRISLYGPNVIFSLSSSRDSQPMPKKPLLIRILIQLRNNILFERFALTDKVRRWAGFYLLCLMVHFFPKYVYLFSYRGGIPNPSQRILKLQNPLNEFETHTNISDSMPVMDEINIVMKGESFDRDNLSSLKGPIFLVNWVDESHVKEEVPLIKRENVYYITGDQSVAVEMLKKGRTPIILIQGPSFNTNGEIQNDSLKYLPGLVDAFEESNNLRILITFKCNAPFPIIGSGLLSIVALSHFAKKINVYGWDAYLEFEPAKHGYWKTLFGLTSPSYKRMPPFASRVLGALFNWYFAYRLNKLPSINIQGYLSQLEHHPRLMNKIEQVLYKVN